MSSFNDALKNPTAQFIISSCLTIVLAAAAIFFKWFLARSKKYLSYSLLTNSEVVNVRATYEGRVEIRFLGRPVRSVRLIIFKLINNGHKAILPGDYIEPVVLRFAGDSRILSAAVVQTDPPGIKKLYAKSVGESQGNEVVFPNELLNSGDWLTIHLLVSDFQGPIAVTGRIVDVKEIKEIKGFASGKRMTFAGLLIAGVLLSLLLQPPFNAIATGLLLVSIVWLSIQRGGTEGPMRSDRD